MGRPRIRELGKLIPPEVDVIRHLADGKNLSQIAQAEGYRNAAVVHQKLRRIKEYSGTDTTSQLVAFAFRKGLIK